jgi:hypothetical protein
MRIKNVEELAVEPAVVHAVAGAVYVVPTANPLSQYLYQRLAPNLALENLNGQGQTDDLYVF